MSISRRMDKQVVVHIHNGIFSLIQFSSVTQSCLTLCDPMDCSTPGLRVHPPLLVFTQTHVHCVSDAIQPSHPVVPISSCLQSFPASGSFPTSHFLLSYQNTFESVLMRWVKLEPIIQSGVRQKEKHQYSILTRIYGIQKECNDDPICKTARETQL